MCLPNRKPPNGLPLRGALWWDRDAFTRFRRSGRMPLLRLLLHVAILELLSAAARAGVVASHTFAAIADRLDRFVGRWTSRWTSGTRGITVAEAWSCFLRRGRVVRRGRDAPQ